LTGLTTYKPQFDNSYEEIFQKVLVAKEIGNGRFMPDLKYGASVERVAYNIQSVRVRTVTRGAASTIDTITDSSETLTINLEKEAVFYISDGEVTQAGPLNPGEVIGGQIAIKVAADFDARIFAEVVNALQTFDTGDLTTTSSTAVPISLTATTVPQMVTRMPAKLRAVNITMTNMALVVDAYAASDIEQYLLGKQFSIVESVFQNGYAGPIATADVYVSQNLTGQFLLTPGADFANTATLSIAYPNISTGASTTVTLTAVSAIGATPGNFLVGTNLATSLTALAGLINNPGTTSANQVALAAADQVGFTDVLKLTATATSTTIKIVGIGAGRMVLGGTIGSGAGTCVTYNMIHSYYGKKGAIDWVLQDIKEVDMRPTSDRRGTNVFSSYLGGVKTFADGARKFLDVWIAA